MKLTFLGTRAHIEAHSRRHRRHASLLVEYRRRRVMIDCGADWRGHLDELKPHAIVLTHGHPSPRAHVSADLPSGGRNAVSGHRRAHAAAFRAAARCCRS